MPSQNTLSVKKHKQALLDALENGHMELTGQFVWGSNYTFLAEIGQAGDTLKAVYKPLEGERPLLDFPDESLAGREVAAYYLSEALGWELVPPTVIRQNGPFGRGSLQLFIPHDPEQTYFTMPAETRQLLRPAAVFDLLANNADRKGSHILLESEGHIWLIDHGLCFHARPKLRTVIWDFSGQPIPAHLLTDIHSLLPGLQKGAQLHALLRDHLSGGEIYALYARANHLLSQPVFPQPNPDKRPFPWPLV